MALYTIYSKDGSAARHTGKMKYVGTYMKPSYVEFSEINSPVPIEWEVGDYVDYPRTGLRYRLYSIPQPRKQARARAAGNAFTYANVQLYAATEELDIALFNNLVVDAEKNTHFSTRESLSTYEDVSGIARRIQACMDEIYPDAWEIKVVEIPDGEDDALRDLLSEAREFKIGGMTCLGALSAIYNTWNGIGWAHSRDAATGRDVITIGGPNRRNASNTVPAFLYGKGRGLTALKRISSSADDFATRIYAYGSDRNLPSRYYNGRSICNAKSVDIPNLMIPMSKWGKATDPDTGETLPDASLAYIQDEGMVEKFGIVPKKVYFNGGENEIYPSIRNVTAGRLRTAKEEAGDSAYVPSASIYPDAERLDSVKAAINPKDNGIVSASEAEDVLAEETHGISVPAGQKKIVEVYNGIAYYTPVYFPIFHIEPENSGSKVIVRPSADVTFTTGYVNGKSVELYQVLDVMVEREDGSTFMMTPQETQLPYGSDAHGLFTAALQEEYLICTGKIKGISLSLKFTADTVPEWSESGSDVTVSMGTVSGSVWLGFKGVLTDTFTMTLKQIGFDMRKQAAAKDRIATVSMTDGMNGGRSFTVRECSYNMETDDWTLTCGRANDTSTGMMYPNASFPVASGDHFVLLDITMPDIYVRIAEEVLYEAALSAYEEASRTYAGYEPTIDAKKVHESGTVLMEGLYMPLEDGDIIGEDTEYVLIDSITIAEDDSALPTYKVTLRDKKKTTYAESTSATLSSLSGEIGKIKDSAAGAVSSSSDKTFLFVQAVPASEWTIEHRLGKRPSVTVTDTAGTVVLGQVTYDPDDPLNRLTVKFSSEFSGTATLN